MDDILKIGAFPTIATDLISREFRCRTMDDLSADEALRMSISGIITRGNYSVTRSIMEGLPNLGVIVSMGVGYDLIDINAARELGISVANTPNVLNDAVAELCVCLMLSVFRQIPLADQFVRSGQWKSEAFPLGATLKGKHVGIVGLGRIGKEIAARLNPFGVTISYHGRSNQNNNLHFEPNLIELAYKCDVLVVIAPGSASTHHIINAPVLEALGKSGFLINIARGSLVDQDALIYALQNDVIAGAALDVFNNEPNIDERFLKLTNVILTPHIGSATNETRLAMARLAMDNLHQFFKDGSVLTPVITN
jgi:lactate dehydrogenase-like 2-hydroxyacid dehydrogenase